MKRLIILITDEQYEYIDQETSRLAISKSEYVRSLLTNQDLEINVKLSSQDIRQYDHKPISKGQRYDVLVRDNSTCKICGNSPAKDNSCKLEIDHIIPRSKGGLTEVNNLQTLCKDCNRGKANKMS